MSGGARYAAILPPRGIPAHPVFTSPNTLTVTVGVPFTFEIDATGYPIPAYTLTGPVPAGIILVDDGDGSAILTGIPTAGTGGPHTLTIVASNGSP